MNKKQKFTLTEVIITVIIIGILPALILPALHAAQTNAKKLSCVDAMKKIASFEKIYTADYDGNLIPVSNGGNLWLRKKNGPLSEYIRQDVMREGIYCPEYKTDCLEKGVLPRYPYIAPNLDNRYFHAWSKLYAKNNPRKISQIVTPAKTLAFTETCDDKNKDGKQDSPNQEIYYATGFLTLDYYFKPNQSFRHNGNANILMLDGHVEQVDSHPKIKSAPITMKYWRGDK